MKKAIILLGLIFIGSCGFNSRFSRVAEKTLPKTVMIYVPTIVERYTLTVEDNQWTIRKSTAMVTVMGAGVIISPNGHILTCAHLFTAGNKVGIPTAVLYNDDTYGIKVLSVDERRDLALLKVYATDLPYTKLADPFKLKVGEELIAIGNPLGLPFSVTHGIVSALNRDFSFRYNATQSDTFINPGNSGGPLFNLNGDLVGINSFVIPPVPANIFTGCGFSVSIPQIIEFLTDYKGLDKVWR